jgi:hypothetical protein
MRLISKNNYKCPSDGFNNYKGRTTRYGFICQNFVRTRSRPNDGMAPDDTRFIQGAYLKQYVKNNNYKPSDFISQNISHVDIDSGHSWIRTEQIERVSISTCNFSSKVFSLFFIRLLGHTPYHTIINYILEIKFSVKFYFKSPNISRRLYPPPK